VKIKVAPFTPVDSTDEELRAWQVCRMLETLAIAAVRMREGALDYVNDPWAGRPYLSAPTACAYDPYCPRRPK